MYGHSSHTSLTSTIMISMLRDRERERERERGREGERENNKFRVLDVVLTSGEAVIALL